MSITRGRTSFPSLQCCCASRNMSAQRAMDLFSGRTQGVTDKTYYYKGKEQIIATHPFDSDALEIPWSLSRSH